MSSRVYVGNLPLDVKEREIDDLFYKYGRIRSIDLKTPSRPPAYAFVDFDDPRDAEDAVRGRDGYDFYGHRIRVEQSHGGRGPPGGGGGGGGGGYGRGGGGGGYDRERGGGGGGGGGGRAGGSLGPSPFGPSRRTDFRVIVTGLPLSASWQDLKDHMRKAGDVTFTQVMKDGRGNMGLVDFATYEDMQTALRKLDDSEFRNPFDRCVIRVREDRNHDAARDRERERSRSRSRSRDRRRSPSRSMSRSRSRSRSRSKSKSRSRSRSRSPAKSESRSRSRSRSRSASPAKDASPARSE